MKLSATCQHTEVKSKNDELRQQSLLLKKLQEDNHFTQEGKTLRIKGRFASQTN